MNWIRREGIGLLKLNQRQIIKFIALHNEKGNCNSSSQDQIPSLIQMVVWVVGVNKEAAEWQFSQKKTQNPQKQTGEWHVHSYASKERAFVKQEKYILLQQIAITNKSNYKLQIN